MTTVLVVLALLAFVVTSWRRSLELAGQKATLQTQVAGLERSFGRSEDYSAQLTQRVSDLTVEKNRAEEQLRGACLKGRRIQPRVRLRPATGPVGTWVEVRGRCFIRDFNKDLFSVSLIGGRGNECVLSVPLRGKFYVDPSGLLSGHFRFTSRQGHCLRGDGGGVARPGLYRFNLGCGTCSWATFEIERRPFWWIDSIDEAMALIARKVDVPVALPPLPPKARLQPQLPMSIYKNDGTVVARLPIYLGPNRVFSATFGHASIWVDGCEPPEYRVVDVNGQRALLSTWSYEWSGSTVVWPVEPGSLDGPYSLSGPVGPRRIIRMAEAMDLAIQSTRFERRYC